MRLATGLRVREAGRRDAVFRARSIVRWAGWLFVLPALTMYAVFVLEPLVLSLQYSLYRWDGIGPASWVGALQVAPPSTEDTNPASSWHVAEPQLPFG